MGWHDATLWAFRVEHSDPFDEDTNPDPQDRVTLDLDYITRWVDPEPGTRHFQFWVAPCTLVFFGVTELELRSSVLLEDERPRSLADIHPVKGGWHVEGHEDFDLKVAAAGFRQTFRQAPKRQSGQSLGLVDRGGHSYSETPAKL